MNLLFGNFFLNFAGLIERSDLIAKRRSLISILRVEGSVWIDGFRLGRVSVGGIGGRVHQLMMRVCMIHKIYLKIILLTGSHFIWVNLLEGVSDSTLTLSIIGSYEFSDKSNNGRLQKRQKYPAIKMDLRMNFMMDQQ